MSTIKIINSEGETRTEHVELCNAETHVAARDKWKYEAQILLDYHRDESLAESTRDPIAFKYEDPIEGQRWVFDETDLAEIEGQDPSLIQRVEVIWVNSDGPSRNEFVYSCITGFPIAGIEGGAENDGWRDRPSLEEAEGYHKAITDGDLGPDVLRKYETCHGEFDAEEVAKMLDDEK